MNYVKIKELITFKDLVNILPLSDENSKDILRHRQEIKEILQGKDKRLILIVGPCSAWPKTAVLEYASRLAILNNKVKHSLKIIMRVYPQKPRSTIGWSGAIFQSDPFSKQDTNEGLKYIREMMLKVVDLGLPIAAEILYTNFHAYYLDLLSWVAIGARSSENQEHRAFASGLDIPTGLKNPTHGSLNIAINSVIAAQNSHPAIFENFESRTHGNKFAHLVLRGGNNKSNYSNTNLQLVNKLMKKNEILNPTVLIDVSHDNSIIKNKKNYREQPQILMSILNNISKDNQLKSLVKGFMIESFIEDGRQDIDLSNPSATNLNGLSLTDPCIDWQETEKLILKLSQEFEQSRS
ncbi:MAG: 3-deoxy-7-phosphoheptulonate synthase [Legionellaceae bacterium]|nr:3-deoxy-7-phosphoheptulonate synthase [Legionellaceae bacterium]